MNGEPQFIAFAIVEMMGHVSIAGRVSEQTLAGASYLRVDIPRKAGGYYTRLLGHSSVYAVNVCSVESAREFAFQMPQPEMDLRALEELPTSSGVSGSILPPWERLVAWHPNANICTPEGK